MHEQRAEALQLTVGKPAALLSKGAGRPVTREALSDGQILGLVKEIAGDSAGALAGGGKVAFGYRAACRPARPGRSRPPTSRRRAWRWRSSSVTW
jgi:hypothetical protein